MTLPHEEAARTLYKSAQNFQPVHKRTKGFFGTRTQRTSISGWVFEVDPLEGSLLERYAWITANHQITSDPVRTSKDAIKNLLAYCDHLETSTDSDEGEQA